MDEIRRNGKDMNRVSVTTITLYAIVLLSFMVHIFSYSLSASAYAVILFVLAVLFAFGKGRISFEKSWYSFIWIAVIVVAMGSLMHSQRSDNSIMDTLCLFCCMLIAVFYSKSDDDYLRAIRFIYILALFFAAGVLIQQFIPSVYNKILTIFPSNYSTAIRAGMDDLVSSGKRGFTTNTGTAAGYICSGIIALISLGHRYTKNRIKFIIALVLLFVALLFTGKRGPALFLALSLFLRYMLPERGTKRMRVYWICFLIVVAFTVLYCFFGSFLMAIPLVKEYAESISGLIAGDDVSNLRFSLYAWALTLFKKNPLIGIGWGEYRNTVVGNISNLKTLDVHNIYLQLLCETGIVGFIVFALLFITFWVKTKNAYCLAVQNDEIKKTKWLSALSFSFSFQSFFLLYGLTGNVLYDQHYQILYGICCAITLAYVSFSKQLAYEING